MLSLIQAAISDSSLLTSVPSLAMVGLVIGVTIVGVLGIKRPAGFPPGPTPIPFVGCKYIIYIKRMLSSAPRVAI